MCGEKWTHVDLLQHSLVEGVAKSIKALNHEGHKGTEKLFFVLFMSFVVLFFSGPFATPLL